MKGLLIKDLRLMLQQKRFFLILFFKPCQMVFLHF